MRTIVLLTLAALLVGCGQHKHLYPNHQTAAAKQTQAQSNINCAKPGGAAQEHVMDWATEFPQGKYRYRDATVENRNGRTDCRWREEAGSKK